ncbi:MAG: hypothetical protein AVDCRST_MAG75-1686 [uncultured Propionibacteriaceae bacterium]|uniref:Uncharacterized protein n=1 Tax=uncultured Propionibacteriaceae bacterium TaxID=257457 RepID=A0A6J4NV31_9ACTN|nr:MAG: hypothetical protein AVDCRST_MAG75-1686 [uncultured Propionibacteriaceae bacterium]
MNPHFLDDDVALLALLGEALAESRHPRNDELMAGALAAFSYRTMDQELASLIYDSMLEPEPVGAERTLDTLRTIVFEADEVSIEIEIGDKGIVGQVVPPGRATVTAEHRDGARIQVVTDELGCFTLDTPGRGPVRLHVITKGTTAVTEWTDLGTPN